MRRRFPRPPQRDWLDRLIRAWFVFGMVLSIAAVVFVVAIIVVARLT